jgi:hypothetical protein
MSKLGGSAVKALGKLETIQGMNKSKMLGHQWRFPALNVADHVPFYSRLQVQGRDFFGGFVCIIFTQQLCAGCNGGLDGLRRLQFGDNYKTHGLGLTFALMRRGRNAVKDFLVAFANGRG